MNLLKNLSEDELRAKIKELNDPFLSYAYVKELEERQKNAQTLPAEGE